MSADALGFFIETRVTPSGYTQAQHKVAKFAMDLERHKQQEILGVQRVCAKSTADIFAIVCFDLRRFFDLIDAATDEQMTALIKAVAGEPYLSTEADFEHKDLAALYERISSVVQRMKADVLLPQAESSQSILGMLCEKLNGILSEGYLKDDEPKEALAILNIFTIALNQFSKLDKEGINLEPLIKPFQTFSVLQNSIPSLKDILVPLAQVCLSIIPEQTCVKPVSRFSFVSGAGSGLVCTKETSLEPSL